MKLKRQETHFFTAIVLPLKCGLFRAGAHGGTHKFKPTPEFGIQRSYPSDQSSFQEWSLDPCK